METKFTKGPWHIDFTDEIYDSNGNNLADVWLFDIQAPETAEANAHLIAAAPDMYDALEQLLGNAEVARFHLHGTEEAETVSSSLFDTINQARAALAKARGEQ